MIILEENSEAEKQSGFGGIKQSKVAIWCFIGILVVDKALILISYLLSLNIEDISYSISFFNPVTFIFSTLIDIFLIVFLLRGKSWARTWMLARLILGFIMFNIIYLVNTDYPSLIMSIGEYIALILLLTGKSTKLRIAISFSLLISMFVWGLSWALIPSEVEEYTNIEIDGLSSILPSNWLGIEEVYPHMTIDYVEYDWATFETYGDVTGRVGITFCVMNMDEISGTEDYLWVSWDQFESDTGITKKDFCEIFIEGMFMEEDSVSKLSSNIISVNFEECYEYRYLTEIEGIPVYVNILGAYGKATLGVVMMVCEKGYWDKFDDCWTVIRDTVEIE